MKNRIGLLAIVLGIWSLPVIGLAQEKSFEKNVKQIAVSLKNSTISEKEMLKVKVDSLNVLVENNTLAEEAAQKLKEQFAAESSERIEQNATMYNDSLTNLVQKEVQESLNLTKKKGVSVQIGGSRGNVINSDSNTNRIGERRTSLRMTGVFGMSNLSTDGVFGSTDLKNNMFTMINGGFYLKTRLFKNNNAMYLRYGVAGELINLKPKNYQYFTVENGQTVIQKHEKDLGKSRLFVASTQLPISFEYDFSKKGYDEKTGRSFYRSEESWRIGVGGYVSFLRSNQIKQVYHYTEDGVKYRVEKKEDLGLTKTKYGLISYVGYGSFALQFSYELTPMFKHNDIEQNLWSVGLRMDL